MAREISTSADLWQPVKLHVWAIQGEDGVLIIDDSMAEKPYTDENDIICWHYDHAQGRQVKGINFLSALYHTQRVSLPIGFWAVAKTEHDVEPQDDKRSGARPSVRANPIKACCGKPSAIRYRSGM